MLRWITRRKLDELDDAQVIARVLKGRKDDYAALVRRHQDAIYRHMRSMGLDYDTAVDLVQDAFVKAFVRLEECDPTRFRAWVFRIARNLSLDHLKNVRRLSVPFSALSDCDDVPASQSDDHELSVTVHAALAALSSDMREAFLLKHQADYTYNEIAEIMGASPSAVKMRVHRAREALHSFLVERGVHAA